VRVGVIGAGWWSTRFHLPSLVEYEHADVVALVDPDEGRREGAARR
jgi:predicted dehydrogenase